MPETKNWKALLRTLTEDAPRRTAVTTDNSPGSNSQTLIKSSHQALIRDAFNYFLSKIVPGLMSFLSVLTFVRIMGVEEYGRYAVVFAFVMAPASGLAGWLSQGILRFKSQWYQREAAENFRHSALVGTILSIAIGGLAVGIAMPALRVQGGWSLVVSLVLLGVLVVYTVAISWLQASFRSAQVLRFEALRSVGSFLIPLALFWVTRSTNYRLLLGGIALGYLLPLFGPVFARARLQEQEEAGRIWRPSLSTEQQKILSDLWSFGWPVALWMLCQGSLVVSDRYFLQRYFGYSAAGTYASMYEVIVRSFSLLFMPITLAVHPIIMNQWNAGNRKHALQSIRTGLKYQLLMFIPIGICLAALAPWVSRLVLGKENAGAAEIVFPLAVGGFLWQVCLLSHKPLEILCQTKRMLAGILAALAINVGGNWLLVPRYGYRASAYLTVASSVVYLLSLFALTPMEELRKVASPDQTAARADKQPPGDEGFVTTSL